MSQNFTNYLILKLIYLEIEHQAFKSKGGSTLFPNNVWSSRELKYFNTDELNICCKIWTNSLILKLIHLEAEHLAFETKEKNILFTNNVCSPWWMKYFNTNLVSVYHKIWTLQYWS